jgi:hypothetical protein
LSNVGLRFVVCRKGIAAVRFSSFGACSGAPLHCLALAQQSAS